MVQVPRRTGVSGPTLIRLLARLTDADIPESRQSLSDRLSLWLGWTDAIALSAVLDGGPSAVPAGTRAPGNADTQEYDRVRATLAHAIADERAFTVPPRQRGPVTAQAAAADVPVEYATYRQRYLSLQQSMETSIGKLRGRLRATLAAQAPGLAKLAMVDAIMERSLSAQERRLLATVPTLLAGHFDRLRQAAEAESAAQENGAPASAAPAPVVAPWLATFRKDMRSVLLAELDIRLQPIEGLLAALRAS